MLKLHHGPDILSTNGGITNLAAAQRVIAASCDTDQLQRLEAIANPDARIKIANAIQICRPSSVFINTGSEEDRGKIVRWSIETGEEEPLALPNHTLHYDLAQEQARLIDRTFYIVNPEEETSSLAKSTPRAEAMRYVADNMRGIMEGTRMIIGFYSRGPVGAKGALPAIEITSSTYVSHSADILYRHCYHRFDSEARRCGLFLTNVHSQGMNRPDDLPNARIFMDRSHLTTYSMFCTYAGNTLLLKKGNHRFAVDLATYYKRGEELSEHMFITGVAGKNDRITFFGGAAPSGCGKTTTAMTGKEFISDDLAQLWVAQDGSIRSINPEKGVFGIIRDVNPDDDPMMMRLFRNPGSEIIFSNLLVDEALTPYWEGSKEDIPHKGRNFQGEWKKGMTDNAGNPIPISHPNARFTLRCSALDNYSPRAEDPRGVITRVFTYSGRDSDTMPPVYVARDPDEGVVIGASIVSKATATEVGATGVKRSPWANQPFIPGALGDYMDAQFSFFNNPKISKEYEPVMAGLNYFLTHRARGGTDDGLIGEKRDVHVWMGWLERRAHREVDAIETPIGFIPDYDDLKRLFSLLIDKEYPFDLYIKHFSLYIDRILSRIEFQESAYGTENNIPKQLWDVYARQKKQLKALRDSHGPVVTPDKLA